MILYSGPESVYQAHQVTPRSLGGTATHLGADPGRAAAHDVALLDLFWTSMSGYVHALALAAAENISTADLLPYAQGDHRPAAGHRDRHRRARRRRQPRRRQLLGHLRRGRDGAHHPRRRGAGAGRRVLTAAKAVTDRVILAGHGDDGFSRLVETLTPPASTSASEPRGATSG